MSHLFVSGDDCAGDLLGDATEVGVGLELHVTLVTGLVVDNLHLACTNEVEFNNVGQAFLKWTQNCHLKLDLHTTRWH